MTDLEFTLLGLLAEHPRHGYDIEQTIEARNMRDWADIGFSSIYYILKKLEKRGLVNVTLAPAEGRGPLRKIYQLTEEGKRAFKQQLAETLATPVNRYSPFLLGLANLPALPSQQAQAALQTYASAQRANQSDTQARQDQLPPGTPAHVQAMFDLSQALINAELGWLDDFLAETYQRKKT
jgi:DNA-binding PadR family transcriptional regulator